MDCREKNENKAFVLKISGGLSFRGLSFRGLSFRPFEILHFLHFEHFLDIPHWQLRWTVGKKTKTKLSSENYSAVLVFEVLVFEVLAFEVLAFEVLVFEVLVFKVLDLRS